jgi:effector-binding domain-containing protein
VETGTVELVDLEPQETAVVTGLVPAVDLPAFLRAAFGDVARALGEQHLGPVGPPFGRYIPGPDGFDVEAGFPAAARVTPSGRVVPLALPGGTVARFLYRGDYAGIGHAYRALEEWLEARDLVAAGRPWECYLDGPEVPQPRTEIYMPCGPR